jgi:hypothetical protein
LDWQAFSAAATLGLPGFSPFRKRAWDAPVAGGEGGAVGRVAGIVTPCEAMHVRNAWNAAVNLPPNPPAGRSFAHACRAFSIAELGEPKPPLGRSGH